MARTSSMLTLFLALLFSTVFALPSPPQQYPPPEPQPSQPLPQPYQPHQPPPYSPPTPPYGGPPYPVQSVYRRHNEQRRAYPDGRAFEKHEEELPKRDLPKPASDDPGLSLAVVGDPDELAADVDERYQFLPTVEMDAALGERGDSPPAYPPPPPPAYPAPTPPQYPPPTPPDYPPPHYPTQSVSHQHKGQRRAFPDGNPNADV